MNECHVPSVRLSALKVVKPWLFTDASNKTQGDKTGLPNARTGTNDGKTMRCRRRIAGLDDTDEE